MTMLSRHDGRLRNLLVGAQVAIAFVLLVGAGLMVRSLVRLQAVDGGYVTTNVISARVDLDWTRYANPSVATNQAPLVVNFDDRLLAPELAHLLRERARLQVNSRTGRLRHDDANGTVRKIVRRLRDGTGGDRQRDHARQRGQ